MQLESKSNREAAKKLREAQLTYAATSLKQRGEDARRATGMSTAERIAALTTNQLTTECPSK